MSNSVPRSLFDFVLPKPPGVPEVWEKFEIELSKNGDVSVAPFWEQLGISDHSGHSTDEERERFRSKLEAPLGRSFLSVAKNEGLLTQKGYREISLTFREYVDFWKSLGPGDNHPATEAITGFLRLLDAISSIEPYPEMNLKLPPFFFEILNVEDQSANRAVLAPEVLGFMSNLTEMDPGFDTPAGDRYSIPTTLANIFTLQKEWHRIRQELQHPPGVSSDPARISFLRDQLRRTKALDSDSSTFDVDDQANRELVDECLGSRLQEILGEFNQAFKSAFGCLVTLSDAWLAHHGDLLRTTNPSEEESRVLMTLNVFPGRLDHSPSLDAGDYPSEWLANSSTGYPNSGSEDDQSCSPYNATKPTINPLPFPAPRNIGTSRSVNSHSSRSNSPIPPRQEITWSDDGHGLQFSRLDSLSPPRNARGTLLSTQHGPLANDPWNPLQIQDFPLLGPRPHSMSGPSRPAGGQSLAPTTTTASGKLGHRTAHSLNMLETTYQSGERSPLGYADRGWLPPGSTASQRYEDGELEEPSDLPSDPFPHDPANQALLTSTFGRWGRDDGNAVAPRDIPARLTSDIGGIEIQNSPPRTAGQYLQLLNDPLQPPSSPDFRAMSDKGTGTDSGSLDGPFGASSDLIFGSLDK